MKKKLIPFIFGLSMLAALPLTAHATDDPEQDSGNVEYGGFVTVTSAESGNTPVLTAIPECTLTIPRDTTIRKGALSANIGRVTVDGKYFVKPYYIELSATRNKFTLVASGAAKGDSALANEDIIFDVATTRKPADESGDDGVSTATGTGHSAADETTFVKAGAITLDNSTKKSVFTDTRAARRFWKQETLTSGQDTAYVAGEVCPINGQEKIWLRIGSNEWTGTSGSEADTRPVGGQYKGNITFTATFKDDYTTGMSVWSNLQ